MTTVQPIVVPAQARSARSTSVWPPPSSGLMHTRPWRSSPLAGPAFSTLPPVIPESSEESHGNDFGEPNGAREPPVRTRSPSSVSQTGSLAASGYGSSNASGSASALVLVEDEASTSSVTLAPSTGPYGTSSSQGHGSSQTHSHRPSRLSKSWGRHTSLVRDDLSPPKDASDTSIKPPPLARTRSHGHSRSASFPAPPLAPSSTIPQTYSRTTPRPRTSPDPDTNTAKQPPSKSRDPASNWMSSSPFGPAQTPKFSRLTMASPAVVMPLSAKQYRKQKARESFGKGKEKDPPASSNRVTFIDNALSAFKGSNGAPVVTISPPSPLEDVHQAPSSPSDNNPDRRNQPQPQAGHPSAKLLPQATMSPSSSSPQLKRPRSRPHTPPRSSPLASHPPISPKSSAGTFFSAISGSEDETVPPTLPRPRPRRRRKSYPDRLSSGARLSLLETMNRLSQGSGSQHRLSGHSQTDGVNRLSVASQASGNTLFYEVGESDGDKGQVTSGHGKANGDATGNGNADGGGQGTPVQHTQSLEDLSSTLARTGIEVVHPNGDDNLGTQSEDARKAKRNVRVVRISDTVEVSPPPVTPRRKLTKSRPGLVRESGPAIGATPGTGPVQGVKVRTQTQTQERRTSLLPWKSRGSGNSKAGVTGVGSGATAAEKNASTPTKALVHPNETITPKPVPLKHFSIANRSVHESHSKPKSNTTPSKKASSNTTAAASSSDFGSIPSSHKSRRYTFSFLPSPTFQRPKPQKSKTTPLSVDLGLNKNIKGSFKGSVIAMERSGTDSTSTSIRTITQGSQTTLVPPSPGLYDLTTPASSGSLSGRGTKSSVPMLRRLNAQEMVTVGLPSPNESEGKRDSTPSLITSGSTGTSSSSPRTPSYFRNGGGAEPFVPRPSALKELFTDTSEEDSEDISGGRSSKVCTHPRHEPSPSARAGLVLGEMSEDERHLRPDAGSHPKLRPGTSSSTLTTATETSGSYLSFSTVPASTASSASSSRSESPTPIADKWDGVEGDEAVYTHQLTTHLPSRSLSPSSTYDPELEGIHPMFTVPLITAPAPILSTHPRSSSKSPSSMPRYANARKRERRMSGSVPGNADVAANVSVPPTRHNRNSNHMHVDANRVPVTIPTRVTATDDKAMATIPAPPPPVPSPQNVKQRDRPQTAPPGTGDAALKFIEEAKAMRAREGGVDIGALIEGDRPTKQKTGRRESKFKTVLKGLLKWGG